MDCCQRIGHGGASAVAPANTLASFEAARDIGIDVVEFDVRACGGELVLAHTLLDARRPKILRLSTALDYLSSPRFAGIELNVDVKHVGCERALLDGLERAGLIERTLISSQVPAVLDRVRALDPRIRTGISIGGRVARASRRWGDWRARAVAGLRTRRWDALMAQHRLVGPGLLDDVLGAGGRLYAWTVNERSTIERLRALGVHGIVSADPRLFV
jgi:glycerophosphoryl diester phosphodiesterase